VLTQEPLRDIIKTERVPFRGREIVRLSHTTRNVSPMFVERIAPLPMLAIRAIPVCSWNQRKLMSRLRLTWEVMQDSTATEGAFISARKSEMHYLIDDMARRDEYALASDGRCAVPSEWYSW